MQVGYKKGTYAKRFAAIFFLLMATNGKASGHNHSLWGKLPEGKYQVGFKRVYQVDYARAYSSQTIDSTSKSNKNIPRPVVINIWYPAQKSTAPYMRYEDYFKFTPNGFPSRQYQQLLTDYQRANFTSYFLYQDDIHDKNDPRLSAKERAIVEKLLSTSTAARANIPAINKKFPVVIYHQGLGGTVEDNSVLCELLAAHGYVVIGACFQSENYSDMNVNWDLERSSNDLRVIFNTLAHEKNMDFDRVALMGHSFGAQAVAAFACSKNTPVKVLVSIDPTFDYDYSLTTGTFAKLYTQLLTGRKTLATPVLAIASKEREPLFLLWDSMTLCNRYYLSVPDMKHDDFTSQGALHSYFDLRNTPDSLSNTKIWTNYQLVCTTILRFLAARFGETKVTVPWGHQELDSTTGSVFETVPKGQAFNTATRPYDTTSTTPPNKYQCIRLVYDHGIVTLLNTISRWSNEPIFSENPLNDLAYAMLYDFHRGNDALRLFGYNAKKHPNSWNVWDSYAEACLVQGDSTRAVKYYNRSLSLDSTNENARKQLKLLDKKQ